MTRFMCLAFVVVTIGGNAGVCQSRHERKARQIEASAQTQTVAGGITFPTPTPIGKCFELVLNYLKRQGQDIELADREAGRIVTVLTVTGNHSQTGTRILVTFIEDSPSQTSVRVVVTTQKRKRLLSTEPWSEPKLDEGETTKVVSDLQEVLKAR